MKTNTNKKHIINPEKMGVQKRNYGNGYDLYISHEPLDIIISRVIVSVPCNVFWQLQGMPHIVIREHVQAWDKI